LIFAIAAIAQPPPLIRRRHIFFACDADCHSLAIDLLPPPNSCFRFSHYAIFAFDVFEAAFIFADFQIFATIADISFSFFLRHYYSH
jgi:hypothetical protein